MAVFFHRRRPHWTRRHMAKHWRECEYCPGRRQWPSLCCQLQAISDLWAPSTPAAQAAQATQQVTAQPAPQDSTQLSPNEHEIFGTISSVHGNSISVATRSGALVDVDATEALDSYQSVVLLVGEPVRMLGTYNASNVFQAAAITRAKASAQLWPPDR